MLEAIFIDAGHGLGPTGAIDDGATANGMTERQLTTAIANDLFGILTTDPAFANVKVIKIAVDNRLTLVDHIKQVNTLCGQNGWTSDTSLLVSIHINAASDQNARGVEAWYQPREGTLGFASALVDQICTSTGLPPRARKVLQTSENRFGRLGIIDDTIPRASLIECGFITNPLDAAFLKDSAKRPLIAKGIDLGIRQYASISPSPSPSPTPVPTPIPMPSTGLLDVPSNAWFASDVALCIQEGLFQMPSNGLFHPERPVTRAELAAAMARHLRNQHNIS